MCNSVGHYTPLTMKLLGGVYWFHSACRPSVRPSVRPSIHPASCVRSVAPTVLVGSIWYLHILSSNFRRCVTCKVYYKITNAGILVVLVYPSGPCRNSYRAPKFLRIHNCWADSAHFKFFGTDFAYLRSLTRAIGKGLLLKLVYLLYPQLILGILVSPCPSKYHWKINCVGRSTVLLEDKLYYWKINCDVGRSGIFSEDAVMKTINRNRWKLPIKENNCKKMTT